MVGFNRHVRRDHQLILENEQADRTVEVILHDLPCSNFGKDNHSNNIFNEERWLSFTKKTEGSLPFPRNFHQKNHDGNADRHLVARSQDN